MCRKYLCIYIENPFKNPLSHGKKYLFLNTKRFMTKLVLDPTLMGLEIFNYMVYPKNIVISTHNGLHPLFNDFKSYPIHLKGDIKYIIK
jgi:hypothetical protein